MKKDKLLKSGYAKKNEQATLRKQYGIEREDVTVKVKSRFNQTLELIFSIIKEILRVALIVSLICLAVLGLCSICYPNIRSELFVTLSNIFSEFKRMLGV